MHGNTDWTDVELPSAKQQAVRPRGRLEDHKRTYEQLRIKCGALGKVEDAHLFFRREMDLIGRLSPWYTRVTYWLYGLVSDYGHSYERPIVGLAGLWALWSALYVLYFTSVDKLHLDMDGMDLALSASPACLLPIYLLSLAFTGGFPVIFWQILGRAQYCSPRVKPCLALCFCSFWALGCARASGCARA